MTFYHFCIDSVNDTLLTVKHTTIFTTSFTPFSARFSAVAADSLNTFAASYAETPQNFGNSGTDVPTVEYTPISTIRASGS